MKSLKIVGVAALLIGAVGMTANAATQNSANTTANATAKIIAPITIVKNAGGDLNFGDVVPGAAVGTVIVTPAGVRSSTGTTTLGNGAAVTAAAFTVGGAPNATYAITLPASTLISFGALNMTVDTFTSTPSGTGNLGAGGSQILNVGATLTVGAAQAAGTYTGTFSVTVTYN